MALVQGNSTDSLSKDLQTLLQTELEQTEKALKETALMLEQSQGEVTKLSQRNAAITTHLQQIQSQQGSVSIEELKMAYDSALDAQQRLFVTRGQLDKLQSIKSHLEQYKEFLVNARNLASQAGKSGAGSAKAAAPAGVEGIINAQEAERQRLSRQMHDGPAQALSNFILQTEIATRLMDIDVNQARAELSNLKAAALGTLQKVRNFIFELRPMMLDDLGLVPTFKRYAETFKEQSGIEINYNFSGTERRLEPFIEVMTFRALQELLGNAARHSQATLVKVHLDITDNAVKLIVDDNGKGFDPDIINQGNSLGLKLIKDRVEMLGGKFEIDSTIGKGTRITFSVPAGVV